MLKTNFPRTTFSKIACAAGSALMIAGIGGAAMAADDMTAVWSKYQEAVRVTEICRGVEHTATDWAKMGKYIDGKVNHEIGGGERLTLIENAKTDARVLVWRKGCKSDDAMQMMALYDSELATAK